MVSANSLQPGDVLKIPAKTAPTAIQEAVSHIKGKRIVVVIDDTGSMNDDRQRVASWYLQATRDAGKNIVIVLLFADGYIRELETDKVAFHTTGKFENTRHALEHAAQLSPDAIVLVTDEPGDDWNDFRNLHVPPVVAHSLHRSADATLEYLARLTGGSFLRSHVGQIAAHASTP